MAITQIDYPVTGSLGSYRNIFPSQKALNINFERRDGLIDTISSGTDGNTRLELAAAYDADLEVGDFVTWFSDGYTLRSNRVTEIVNGTTFDVDNPFNSTDATNGFVNYRKQWFLEARFVAKDTATDDQDAILVLDDYSQIPSARDGSLSLDCSIVGDLLIPESDYQVNEVGIFTEFKVQFRESYSTERDLAWVSPTPDVPIMLVHASKDLPFNDFIDQDINQGRFWWGYPLVFNYVYSSINDNNENLVSFYLSEYSIDKQLISTTLYGDYANLNGVLYITPNIIFLNENTAFIEMTALVTSSAGQYSLTDYDGTQYA